MPSSGPESREDLRPRRLRLRRGLAGAPSSLIAIGFRRCLGLGLLALGLHRGLQFGCDQLVVLGAQVDLLGVRDGCLGAIGGAVVAEQVVLALELLDLLNGDLELVGHPSIGTTLSYPASDLV